MIGREIFLNEDLNQDLSPEEVHEAFEKFVRELGSAVQDDSRVKITKNFYGQANYYGREGDLRYVIIHGLPSFPKLFVEFFIIPDPIPKRLTGKKINPIYTPSSGYLSIPMLMDAAKIPESNRKFLEKIRADVNGVIGPSVETIIHELTHSKQSKLRMFLGLFTQYQNRRTEIEASIMPIYVEFMTRMKNLKLRKLDRRSAWEELSAHGLSTDLDQFITLNIKRSIPTSKAGMAYLRKRMTEILKKLIDEFNRLFPA